MIENIAKPTPVNSGVTEPNLTKFLHDVEKLLLINMLKYAEIEIVIFQSVSERQCAE